MHTADEELALMGDGNSNDDSIGKTIFLEVSMCVCVCARAKSLKFPNCIIRLVDRVSKYKYHTKKSDRVIRLNFPRAYFIFTIE